MDHPALPAAPKRWPLTLLVIALHLLLLVGLQWSLGRRPAPPAAEAQRVTVLLLQNSATRAPARAERLPVPRTQPERQADRSRALERPEPSAPVRVEPPAPAPVAAEVPQSLALPSAPAASAARERLLDSAATRSAVRQATREPLSGERHLTAQGQEVGVSASEKLGRRMQQAGHGDCAKGQFAGAGMGLLSAPFYLLAEASGKCAKGSPPPAGPPPAEPSGRHGAHASIRER